MKDGKIRQISFVIVTKYDAIVVGGGPNGLSAAITLQQAGITVLLLEGKETIGGGLRTAEITLPGYLHDICSAIHPMAVASPFFATLPLKQYGLEYIYPDVAAAHPFDDGSAAVLKRSFHETAQLLGADERSYTILIAPLLKIFPKIAPEILGPLQFPEHPLALAQFGIHALTSASFLSGKFQTEKAKALWAGMAALAIQSLSNAATSAIGLVLIAAAHLKGWPIAKGGSVSIANALANHFISLGGTIETNAWVRSLKQLPTARVVLFDVTPRQLLQIAGDRFSSSYTKQLQRYQYGMGVFKVDWALQEPIPFTAPECRQAGTVHLGSTLAEITASEQLSAKGVHPVKPFVLLAQPSVFDTTRAPQGKHTAWAYCHVPHGSLRDMTDRIENQVERFAPGFKDRILARHTMNTAQMEAHNPNYIGGDIGGGVSNIGQLFTRPALRWSPYRTSAKGIYICSSSTPPGGGVHGMCGYYAAKRALKDVFNIKVSPL